MDSAMRTLWLAPLALLVGCYDFGALSKDFHGGASDGPLRDGPGGAIDAPSEGGPPPDAFVVPDAPACPFVVDENVLSLNGGTISGSFSGTGNFTTYSCGFPD